MCPAKQATLPIFRQLVDIVIFWSIVVYSLSISTSQYFAFLLPVWSTLVEMNNFSDASRYVDNKIGNIDKFDSWSIVSF